MILVSSFSTKKFILNFRRITTIIQKTLTFLGVKILLSRTGGKSYEVGNCKCNFRSEQL